jgi:pilus assembly protein Flp/PilA
MRNLIDWMNAAHVRMTVRDEEGQGLVEYALIIALIAVMLVAALVFLQGGIENLFNRAADSLNV